MRVIPPQTIQELITRARQLAGRSLGELAEDFNINLPSNLLYAKGIVGQLLEIVLGTTAGSRAVPDFESLGIELKTLPLAKNQRPKESTYVCTVPMLHHAGLQWRDSIVYQKLAHVLWVPVQADPEIPIAERRIGNVLLWQPTSEQEKVLRQDWEELMECVSLGGAAKISARLGTYLQIRPKAAHSRILEKGIGENGEIIKTLPLGFYLRPTFTATLLSNHYFA